MARQRVYYERGRPVEVLTWWAGRGPRSVLIRRAGGQLIVRPFRGLCKAPPRGTHLRSRVRQTAPPAGGKPEPAHPALAMASSIAACTSVGRSMWGMCPVPSSR